MTATPTRSAPLDRLLRQSLDALARTDVSRMEATASLSAVLARIAFNFRSIESVMVHTIVEPAAVELRLNGQAVRAPRLLVQCTWCDAVLTAPLTFVYTPLRIDCIALQIRYGTVAHRVGETISYTPLQGWHIPAHGDGLSETTHAAFLRTALQSSGLFSAPALSLEPINNDTR